MDTVTRGLVILAWTSGCLALGPARAVEGDEPQVAHMVYFSLRHPSPETTQKLVGACKKYLGDHEGTVYFSVGVLADDMARDVNDRDFDVSLNLVFRNRASHDQYQNHPRHLEFIAENKSLWKTVRVFDSYLSNN